MTTEKEAVKGQWDERVGPSIKKVKPKCHKCGKEAMSAPTVSGVYWCMDCAINAVGEVKPTPNHGPWMICPVCGITVFCPQCEDRKKEADE